ncbi:tyrosine-type recombinase/integrase [Shouchella clausii]|uniref:tyrosine-type recombinase/integrase n=1 Tax=Shouchella clausii TaxID=79880 RepID=UPI001C73B14B|nr:site-specific integrase [Shouchella clausii]MBX0320200.1 tyrosine-type recombinase/integrase [Shouchella clausii]
MAAQKKLPPISDEWFKENVHEFNQEVTQEFIDQQHLSPETLKTYKSNLYQFFKFVHDNCSNKSILKLRKKDALKYQNFLLKNGLSPNATKNKRATVSSLCNYIMLYYEDEREFRNIFNGVPNPSKSVVHKKTPLTKDEFDILVSHFTEKGNWQIVAYLWFVYETGARREEVRQLKREVVYYSYFVDQETGEETDYYESHDIRAKGRGAEGKRRKFYFGDQAMDALKKWHDARGEDECPYMFVKKTKDGKTQQLSPTTFNYWCSKYFSEILGKRVHPHLFRSTRATHLVVNEGYDIEAAQELLGHESSETTQIYVVKEGGQNMSKIFKKKK